MDNHNHGLLTPKSTSLLRGHRVISRAQKNLIDTLSESGVSTRTRMLVLSKEFDGDYKVGCVVVDIQNYLGNKRRKLLQDGDAQRMYSHFIECQLKNPSFLYAIQVDEHGRMRNCFWVDARSRTAYQHIDEAGNLIATNAFVTSSNTLYVKETNNKKRIK